jgi:hypothetical protein
MTTTGMRPGQRCTLAVSAAHGTGHVFKPEFALAWERNRFLAWETRCPYVEPVSKPPGEPVPCKPWCGTVGVPKSGKDCFHVGGGSVCYCSEACRDHRCSLYPPAPGSALPLPGPPAREPLFGWEGKAADLERDLTEARTALASKEAELATARKYLAEAGDEMRRRWNALNESLAENRALEARLAVTVGALERLGREPCAFDGSYANCWEAIEADDIDAGEGIPCARCVSLQALESLPDARAALAPTGEKR